MNCVVFAQQNEEKTVPSNNINIQNNSNYNNGVLNNNTNTWESEAVPSSTEEIEVQRKERLGYDNKAKTSQSEIQFKQYESQSSYMRTQRTPTAKQQEQMDEAVQELKKTQPKSFEYHYFTYVAGNNNVDLFEHLLAAEKLRPNNADVQVQMAGFYIIQRNDQLALSYLTKLVESNRLSSEAVSYAHDLLKSVEIGGKLITHGFEDTYSVVYAQLAQGIRKDVKVVSLDFLQSDFYRSKLQSDGLIVPSQKVVNVDFMQQLCALNESKNINISMTVPKEYLKSISTNLYVVGLVFVYSKTINSNAYMNDFVWNKEMDRTLVNNATTMKGKDLSANYLPMLLLLRNYYAQLKETESLKAVDLALDKVSVQCNKYEQVKKLKSAY